MSVSGDPDSPLVLAFAGLGMRADGFSDRSGLAASCGVRGWSYYCPESPGLTWKRRDLMRADDIVAEARNGTGSDGHLVLAGHSAGATMAQRMLAATEQAVGGLIFYSGTWSDWRFRWAWPPAAPVFDYVGRVAVCWDASAEQRGGEGRWAFREGEKCR